jgi:pyruvate formate lyase activating enzyme
MEPLHEARFYEPLPGGDVRCTLCPHDCRIRPGGRGACAVRYAEAGKLYTLVGDRVVAGHVDPIEKKPLFHFFPGSSAYSIGTVGCNLRCTFCQNWEISQWPREGLPRRLAGDGAAAGGREGSPAVLAELAGRVPGRRVTPRELVASAVRAGCRSIAYTYTEPTIFYELAYETAVLARARGLANVFVTNGYISPGPLRELATVLDAANVDLKFMDDGKYRRVCRARLAPILDAIRLYRQLGVWVEVTTLVIPGLNDSDDELGRIAAFVRSVGPEVPWHVSRFHPCHELQDRPATPVPTLRRAAAIGRAAGLRHVYQGNVPGEGEDTTCPGCGTCLVERYGFHVRSHRALVGRCPTCGAAVDGVGMAAA